jgi:hypothetical protein
MRTQDSYATVISGSNTISARMASRSDVRSRQYLFGVYHVHHLGPPSYSRPRGAESWDSTMSRQNPEMAVEITEEQDKGCKVADSRHHS